MRIAAVIAAGGKGTRMGAGENKVYLKLLGEPIIRRTVRIFENNACIDDIIIVTGENDIERCRELTADFKKVKCIAPGGATRQQSVYNGICRAENDDIILVTDAARALTEDESITAVIHDCMEYGAAALGVKVKDTLKASDGGFISGTLDRDSTYFIQTPQAFFKDVLLSAHEAARESGLELTDDCAAAERVGIKIKITEGSYDNIKLTTPEDMAVAENILRKRRAEDVSSDAVNNMRIGCGYDVHRLAENRELILCGVKIPYERGLLGHSDADVAIHALADAILGAAALGDIGKHFPDSDPKYKGADSRMLLREVVRLIQAKGMCVGNADITIVAQRPRLAGYIDKMRENMAKDLEVVIDDVSVKATTTEQLGFEGRGEGISASAVVLLRRNTEKGARQ